jgi:hypothetical protein
MVVKLKFDNKGGQSYFENNFVTHKEQNSHICLQKTCDFQKKMYLENMDL